MSFEEIFYFVTKKAVSMRFVVFCKRIFIVIKRRQQMISTDEGYMRLEYFSENVAADKKRKEFDIKNHALCYTNQKPDFLFIGDSITEYWELNAYFGSGNHFLVNRALREIQQST